MRLLSSALMRACIEDNSLSISPLRDEYLLPSCYYFRLGPKVWSWDPDRRDHVLHKVESHAGTVTVPPRGYVYIHSLERFSLSSRVLGLIGQPSVVQQRGLRLNYSPTIDPGFTGHLELGLENLLETEVVLSVGERIGKAVFFDVSDSGPIEGVEATINEPVFRRREEISGVDEGLRDAYLNLHSY